jgi:hypothetical protein
MSINELYIAHINQSSLILSIREVQGLNLHMDTEHLG